MAARITELESSGVVRDQDRPQCPVGNPLDGRGRGAATESRLRFLSTVTFSTYGAGLEVHRVSGIGFRDSVVDPSIACDRALVRPGGHLAKSVDAVNGLHVRHAGVIGMLMIPFVKADPETKFQLSFTNSVATAGAIRSSSVSSTRRVGIALRAVRPRGRRASRCG